MKSPFTGKEMKHIYEKRVWKFRGEEYEYFHLAWQCEDTGDLFTTDESDTAGFVQVTNQYRERHGIAYTDEIVSIRKRYGLSASKMSAILGLGINQYRLYEQGEVPSISNGRMIRSIMNPEMMLGMVEMSRRELSPRDYECIVAKVRASMERRADDSMDSYETSRVFCVARGAENGYAQISLSRLRNVMLYVLNRCEDVWCTKMNKLLFYIDFLSYRERGTALTGLSYRAIDLGPVPEHWDRVYSSFPEITPELRQIGDFVGSVLRTEAPVESSVLSDEDILIIDKVCDTFGAKTSCELSRISHNEDAWVNNHLAHQRIPFSEAFSLKAL